MTTQVLVCARTPHLIVLVSLFASLLLPFDGPAAADQIAMPTDAAEIIRANNTFAVELYLQLKVRDGNLLFSPVSISNALAMTYGGWRGHTVAEMANVPHFTLQPERLHSTLGAMLRDSNAPNDGYQLRVADALWGEEGSGFLADFLKLTAEHNGAAFRKAAFAHDTEAARQTINQWVEEQTEHQITDLIQTGVLNPQTRLVLTDAIYFKGVWDEAFKKADTEAENFFLTKQTTIKTSMMFHEGDLKYYDGGSFQAVEIPYNNKSLSMIVLLPATVDGLAALESSLTPDTLSQWMNKLQQSFEGNIRLFLPAFTIKGTYRLNDPLSNLGLKSISDPVTADFTGIAPSKQSHEVGRLFRDLVIHRALIEVNEEGNEAPPAKAAETDVMPLIEESTAPAVEFRANHPFLFMVRDNHSGGVVLIGRIQLPGSQ